MTKTYIDELAEEIARLRQQNNKLNEMCNYWRIEETERTMECYKLKQLLKECRDGLEKIKHIGETKKLGAVYQVAERTLAKIDEVLK